MTDGMSIIFSWCQQISTELKVYDDNDSLLKINTGEINEKLIKVSSHKQRVCSLVCFSKDNQSFQLWTEFPKVLRENTYQHQEIMI